jgi:hypothetical protein
MSPEPSSAGVHVHVGVPGISALELAVLARAFASVERDLMRTLDVAEARRPYTQPTDPSLLDFIDSREPASLSIPDMLGTIAARDHALNLHSLAVHGTVEFRLFNSTLDPGELERYGELAMRLVERLRARDPTLIGYLTSGDSLDSRGLFRALGLSPPPQGTPGGDAETRGSLSLSIGARLLALLPKAAKYLFQSRELAARLRAGGAGDDP